MNKRAVLCVIFWFGLGMYAGHKLPHKPVYVVVPHTLIPFPPTRPMGQENNEEIEL